jgi:hypothetical protein
MIKWISLITFALAVILLSVLLNHINPIGKFPEGSCVMISVIGAEPIKGFVYNVRIDNRYEVIYLNNLNQLSRKTVKGFMLEPCEEKEEESVIDRDTIPN